MMMKKLVLLMFVAACGGDGDNGDNANPDANQPPGDGGADAMVDAAPATVMTVDCATATIAREVMTVDNPKGFTPNDITINVNDVVRFTTGTSHNVAPTREVGLSTDPGLSVGFGTTACLKFTAVGTFNYVCRPHEGVMKGVVRVEQL